MGSLALTCTPSTPCGQAFHSTLGFGGSSTSAAAAYPSGLCAAYAGALFRQLTAGPIDIDDPLDRLEITANGVVRRHVDRGAVKPSQRDMQARADATARAGRKQMQRSALSRGRKPQPETPREVSFFAFWFWFQINKNQKADQHRFS